MTRTLCLAILTTLFTLTTGAEEKMDIKAFLHLVRHPQIKESWALMKGEVTHRVDSKTITIPIEFRARFMSDRALAQVVFNQHEKYLIGQNYDDGISGTTVDTQTQGKEGETALRDIGLRPSDLTLSFIHWDFQEELPPEQLRGKQCRVVRLKHPKENEQVKVWIIEDFLFPLKAEWYTANATEPYRTLELKAFKEIIKDLYMVTTVRIQNKGWKTEVKFDKNEMGEVTPQTPVPEDLFLKD